MQNEERGEESGFKTSFLEDFDCSTVITVRVSRLKKSGGKKLCSMFVLPIWRSCLPPAVYTLRKKVQVSTGNTMRAAGRRSQQEREGK